MKYFTSLAAVACALLFTGCAYVVNYDSSPRGANVICNGSHVGTTPVSIEYPQIDPDTMNVYRTGCIIQWASGAVSDVSNVNVFGSGSTDVQAQRPDYPNADLDYRVEYEREQIRIEQEALELQRERLREEERRAREERQRFEEMMRREREDKERRDQEIMNQQIIQNMIILQAIQNANK